MARTKISEFSSTPGNNTDIDSINIAEGCAPSGINDAIRELMAQLKDFQAGTAGDSFNGPIGTTTAAAGAFTTLSASGAVTLSGGTANGVVYANGSKVLTTGSALTFDGTDLATTGGVRLNNSQYYYGKNAAGSAVRLMGINSGNVNYIGAIDSGPTDAIYGAALTFTNQAWYVGGSEQMRLTSTGLGIGTSSPGYRLQVYNNINGTPFAWGNATRTGFLYQDASGVGITNAAGTSFDEGVYLDTASSRVVLYTNSVDRLTIDSSGNLLVGTTTMPNSTAAGLAYNRASTFLSLSCGSTTAATAQVYFTNGNGTVGSISTNGSTTTYNITSDQRLKENITNADEASALIDAIQVRKYDWKSDGSHQRYGFVAQELVTVAPEAVHQPEDPEEMMAVDYSKLVPMLVKEIQSLRQRLAAAGI